MAEKTPLEEMVRKAFDMNLRYWETVWRATTDYVEAAARLWASMSQRATISPILPAWSMSLDPLPPTPIPAMRIRSLAPKTDFGRYMKPKVAAADLLRNSRRDVWNSSRRTCH